MKLKKKFVYDKIFQQNITGSKKVFEFFESKIIMLGHVKHYSPNRFKIDQIEYLKKKHFDGELRRYNFR